MKYSRVLFVLAAILVLNLATAQENSNNSVQTTESPGTGGQVLVIGVAVVKFFTFLPRTILRAMLAGPRVMFLLAKVALAGFLGVIGGTTKAVYNFVWFKEQLADIFWSVICY